VQSSGALQNDDSDCQRAKAPNKPKLSKENIHSRLKLTFFSLDLPETMQKNPV
jgi:hypothetical protein